MRQFLDRLYKASGVLAALCLLAILCVIVAQMLARWLSIPFPGSTAYAGYLMAASSFLAFAHALNSGAHIRVSLLINALRRKRGSKGGGGSFWLEVWCMAIGTLAATYLGYYAVKAIYWSLRFHEVSQGQDATPIWIVLTPVAVGAILLAVCFWDNLVTLAVTGKDNIIGEKLEGPEV